MVVQKKIVSLTALIVNMYRPIDQQSWGELPSYHPTDKYNYSYDFILVEKERS